MVVSPPKLLMVEQDAASRSIPPPSVLRQLIVPELSVSCITIVPEPALLRLPEIEAVKAPNVGDMPTASTSDENTR